MTIEFGASRFKRWSRLQIVPPNHRGRTTREDLAMERV